MQLALTPGVHRGIADSRPATSATRLRPYLVAGVALAGANMIAVNPVAPSVPDIQQRAVALVSSATGEVVDLTAAAVGSGPIGDWVDVFSTAFSNVGAIGHEMLADPLPVLSQVLSNQIGFAQTLGTALQDQADGLGAYLQVLPEQLQTLFSAFASGDFTDSFSNFTTEMLMGLLPLALPLQSILGLPGEMAANLTAVLNTLPGIGLNLLLGPLSLAFGTGQALADSAQAVVDAGDPLAAFTALLDTPALVTGAFLNGYAYNPGLLSPESIFGFPFTGGPLDALLVGVPQTIAQALGASAGASALAGLNLFDPSALTDIGSLFDPSMFSDIGSLFGADLVPNLGSMLLELFTSF